MQLYCSSTEGTLHTYLLPLMVASEDKVVIYVACSKGVGTGVLDQRQVQLHFSPMNYRYVCANEVHTIIIIIIKPSIRPMVQAK